MISHSVPLINLNNDIKMPQLGLGTWQMNNGHETEEAVLKALELGYRLIDTAAVYGNEASVGRAIKRSGVSRKDIFVTTKLWNADQGAGAITAFEKSLEYLDVSYIDLFLIHWPAPAADKYIETWQHLEKLYADKRIRSIGVSNFSQVHLENIMAHSTVMPAVNQIELHPHFQEIELTAFCKQNGIQIEAYSPLGGQGGSVLQEKTVEDIALKHSVSPAQVVLRWHTQKGYVVIPKATNQEHLKSNLDIFRFALDKNDMAAIDSLETGRRRGPDPDQFNSGIKTGLVQLAHKFNLVHWKKERK